MDICNKNLPAKPECVFKQIEPIQIENVKFIFRNGNKQYLFAPVIDKHDC